MKITAYKFLVGLSHVPLAMNGNKPLEASNGEKRRWLEQRAVIINGKRLLPGDDVEFPIQSLIFFPGSQLRRCTMQLEDWCCCRCGIEMLGLSECPQCKK